MSLFGPGWNVYAVAATVIALELLALAGLTGSARLRSKRHRFPEDARALRGTVSTEESEAAHRASRAHANLLENAVPFFVVGALFAATGPSRTTALGYFGTFVAARIVHAIVYLLGLQPWRTLAFVVGVLATLGMALHVLRAAMA